MRQSYNKKLKITVFNAIKLGSITAFYTVLLGSGFYLGSLLISYLTNNLATTTHPTSIPWIKEQGQCEETGRTWQKNKCWDYEHNPSF
ncbi:MAG TPA: hypothetical protein VK184_04495 [Nostocaceae cyanobacterium]|nr:hypothetical protein [Nostocaceae cyanobacterium]